VDATSVVAVAGLVTTAVTALGVPLIQGRVAKAGRLYEQRLAAYIDAMAFMHTLEANLEREAEVKNLPFPMEPRWSWHTQPLELITARLNLLAPSSVQRDWGEFVKVWEDLSLTLDINHEVSVEDSTTVRERIPVVSLSLRRAMGVTG
jgi:hypothetical protein